MNHDELKQLLSAYYDKETAPDENRMIEEHLRTCEECRQSYRELSKLSLSLKSWQNEVPSPDLEQKLKKITEREGFNMKNLFKPVNTRIAGGVLVGLLVVVVFNQLQLMRHVTPVTEPTGSTTKQEVLKMDAAPEPAMEFETASQIAEKAAPQVMRFRAEEKAVKKQMAEYASVGALFDRVKQSPSPYPVPPPYRDQWAPSNTENYASLTENAFLDATQNPLSTFSIDVDTASYANIRRFLNENQMPPTDAVRIEEMINYFTYDYPQPADAAPFSVQTEVAPCPWKTDHELLMVGIQGKNLDTAKLPPSNLVFLIDVSGSMDDPNKLPLLKSGLRMLVNQLRPSERVAIVVYAGSAGLVLPPTPGSDKETILQAIEKLDAGGSTAGGEGIKLAYKIAQENFIKDGNNRVILATDGDFNVGASSDSEMVRLIEEKRNSGVFLSVLGFGTGNLKDSRMEQLADKGNGNYHYIDSLQEARKVLVQELGSNLFTIAKDVKIQMEFNPAKVKAYRLIGYENRVMAKEDFNDDKKDAGELGAGHTVTALYEIVPAGSPEKINTADGLKYQQTQVKPSDDLLTVKLRYKEPDKDVSQLIEKTVSSKDVKKDNQSENFRFAAAVAEFGMLLRHSEHQGTASYPHVLTEAQNAKGKDPNGYREEFIKLVKNAEAISPSTGGEGIRFKGQQN